MADRLRGWPADRREAVGARIGFAPGQRTLRAIGDDIGLSHQGAQRMIASAIAVLRPASAGLIHVGGMAWTVANDMVPARWARVRSKLVAAGFIDSMDIDGFLAVGDLIGAEPRLSVCRGYLVTRGGFVPPVEKALSALRRRLRSAGVYRARDVISEAGLDDVWNPADFALDISDTTWATLLPDSWAMAKRRSGTLDRLGSLIRKMLAACGPLDVDSLCDGLDRQVRFGRLPGLPPRDTLLAYLKNCEEFDIDGVLVSARSPLLPEEELSRTELTLWKRLSEDGGGPLSRQQLRGSALDAGVDIAAFATAISYSPILQQYDHGRWAIRGKRLKSAKPRAERVRRDGRASRYTWDEHGRLRITSVLSSPESTVVSIPRAVREMLDGREFEAVAENGDPVGTIRVRAGRSWGYDRFLAQRGHESGELLSATFDFNGRVVSLATASRALKDV